MKDDRQRENVEGWPSIPLKPSEMVIDRNLP